MVNEIITIPVVHFSLNVTVNSRQNCVHEADENLSTCKSNRESQANHGH